MKRIVVTGLTREDARRINQIVGTNFVETPVRVATEDEKSADSNPCEAACELAAGLAKNECKKLPGFLQEVCLLAVAVAEAECKKQC